jgi:hypothetical protein
LKLEAEARQAQLCKNIFTINNGRHWVTTAWLALLDGVSAWTSAAAQTGPFRFSRGAELPDKGNWATTPSTAQGGGECERPISAAWRQRFGQTRVRGLSLLPSFQCQAQLSSQKSNSQSSFQSAHPELLGMLFRNSDLFQL